MSDEKECKCTLRASLVGDGCSICNPELAGEYMSEENEETEEYEPTRCRKCGRHYNLRVGEDPTPYCDWCAHKVVEELTAKLADAERSSGHHIAEAKRNFEENCKITIERDAAIARAEAAERQAELYRKDLCEIAAGCEVGVPDQAEAKRRIIAIKTERDELRREAERLVTTGSALRKAIPPAAHITTEYQDFADAMDAVQKENKTAVVTRTEP